MVEEGLFAVVEARREGNELREVVEALARASRAAICGVGSGGEEGVGRGASETRVRDDDAGERRDGEDARTSAPSEVNPIVPSDARAKERHRDGGARRAREECARPRPRLSGTTTMRFADR